MKFQIERKLPWEKRYVSTMFRQTFLNQNEMPIPLR
uniref:Uncharacterized protein n=2 Tax=Populus TaxID=3689 RepID=A9PK63_9ROSI|nr:unknown [Populus trichocarpa x Populus deltoides]